MNKSKLAYIAVTISIFLVLMHNHVALYVGAANVHYPSFMPVVPFATSLTDEANGVGTIGATLFSSKEVGMAFYDLPYLLVAFAFIIFMVLLCDLAEVACKKGQGHETK